jgi:hypothetical protein
MKLLSKFSFSEYTRHNNSNPKFNRRRKLVAKIDEQILLATESNFAPTKIKWLKDAEGVEQKVEVPKRIKQWWNESRDGKVQLTIRYGSKPIEFEKGKCAISVATLADVSPTLETVKLAVENGELDDLLEAQFAFGKRVAKPKPK